MLIAIFFAAWRAPQTNVASVASVTIEVIGVSAVGVLAFCTVRSGRPGSYRMKRSLVERIYAMTVSHLKNGHDILAPNGFSDRTSVIALGVDPVDGTVMIQERPISGACRRYSISKDGLTVHRTVIEVEASGITSADRTWVQAELTYQRLRILFEALSKSELYEPRRSYITA